MSHSPAAPETLPPDPVLAAERAHLARAADCLTEMRAAAAAVIDAGVDAWASERLGAARAERLRSLAADPGVPAFFGRTDTSEETFHIGRRHVRDGAGDPIVIDWRAPMSRPFYQASALDPQGLVRRRRFGFAAGELTGYEDESLVTGDDQESRFLREEIERPRSGPMRDIVATIQPDQDDIVRAPLAESICVQGAPGTGKTAVGLHRAAYLLYTHGGQLARSGVLVVGPNRAFLRYIEEVLPTLGEVDVDQTTVAGLTARVPVRAVDRPAVAVLKGDARMAEVLRRALWGEIAKPTDSTGRRPSRAWQRPDTLVRPLTRGYRVPGEVLDFANRLLPLIAPGLPAPTAVRSDPGALSVRSVTALGQPLVDVVVELAAVPGSIGIVCPDSAVAEVVGLLTAAGIEAAALTDDGDGAAAVAVVPATLAKGLDFDAVVVVDPAAIVAAEPRGLHRLYVVLTRAVSTLVVLHLGDLPAALTL